MVESQVHICAGVGSLSISVEDQLAVQRLMHRYARCADHKDYAGFAEVFCKDAIFLYMGEPVHSLAAIQEMMLTLEKYDVTMHQVQNVFYDVESDAAEGETYCIASHLHNNDGARQKIDMGIIYRDQLHRTAGGWRIAQREFNLLWSQTSTVD